MLNIKALKSSCVISELSHHFGTSCSLLYQHEAKFHTLHQFTHGYTWQIVCKKVRLMEMTDWFWRQLLATLFSKLLCKNKKWPCFFFFFLVILQVMLKSDGIDTFLILSVIQYIRYRLFASPIINCSLY